MKQLHEEPRSGGHPTGRYACSAKPLPRTTLLDSLSRPIQDLRISVIDACNLRCTYCMPPEAYPAGYRFLGREERLKCDEIVRLASVFCELGVSKLRLTGGEPLLRDDLVELVGQLSGLQGVEDIALTTNGIRLAAQAGALKIAGLGRVTVSLDTLDDDIFGRMNGRHIGVGRVLEGIEAAKSVGLVPVKVNAVVQKGVNDHTVLELVEHFRGSGVILRFIEYMDVGNRNGWQESHVVTSREILGVVNGRYPLRAIEPNYPGEVADRYAFLDGQGEIGFISSVSQPFCGDCTRARLSTDGKLFTCLFASTGVDLRGPMRDGASNEELLGIIASTWRARSDRYSEQRSTAKNMTMRPDKIEMYQIGG